MKKVLKFFVRGLFWPWIQLYKLHRSCDGIKFFKCLYTLCVGLTCGFMTFRFYVEYGPLFTGIYFFCGFVCAFLMHLFNTKHVEPDDQWLWLCCIMSAYLLWPIFTAVAILGGISVVITCLYCWAYDEVPK